MLRYMTESSKPATEFEFKKVTDNDKLIEIFHAIRKFAKMVDDGSIEILGNGVLYKSSMYNIVMLGDIVRINYYQNTRTSIFQYLELDLQNGDGEYNIQKWPADLMQLYQNILNIANS